MIIFNFGSIPIKYDSKRPQDIVCHNCKHKGQTFVDKHLKYFHILYIPILTYNYWVNYQCVRCNSSVDEKDLSKENQEIYKHFKTKKNLPIWTFSGLLAVILIPMMYHVLT